ncbi:VanZ family protein [Marinactinospora thermotolerans]|uniref:Glycopeptide antibiotics resistance protein n=1 Tax=Marinactinospora thermotolerans DSM 45154 TaxID=1122192 RepID=A0A1T4MVA2_9ACTN|nr:VanZ family protein [Marinactinospora thermotolerans]SJZ70705.1 Glycopeptide antibiotics resistance protein [Marinactinospora thermotolerans DSM 45154]
MNVPSPQTDGQPGPVRATPTEPGQPSRLRAFGVLVLRALAVLVAFVAMVGFAAFLAQITLTPVPGAVGVVHSNLEPGASLRLYLDAPAHEALKQVGGNVVLGVPFGVLLPVLLPRTRGVRVVLLTALVMLLVEVAQGLLVTGRAFDIDDVILNTSGALIGYAVVGRRIARTVHRSHRRRRGARHAARAEPGDEATESTRAGAG